MSITAERPTAPQDSEHPTATAADVNPHPAADADADAAADSGAVASATTAPISSAEAAAALDAETVIPDGAPTYPIYEIGHHGDINPADLVIGANRRKTVVLSSTFVNSIKALGVQQRIHVYQDEAGHMIIEDGQRRALGALKAGRELVPYEVIERPATARLIYQQLALNEQERMTTGDTAAAHLQLHLLGETAGTIARTSGRAPKEVKHLLAVGKSAAAAAAADQYDLDLPQLLVFAEFDDDPAAQRNLHDAIRFGNFAHVAQRLRDNRAERDARQKLVDEAAAQSIPIVSGAGYGHTEQTLRKLGITDDAAVQQHRETCKGHAIYLEAAWVGTGRELVATPVCADPIANGHTVPDHVRRDMGVSPKKKLADMEPKEAEKARAAHKLVIDNNKDWQSAVVVRRRWIAEEFAKRPQVPPGAEMFIVTWLLRNPFFLREGLTNALPQLALAMLPDGAKHPLVNSELAEHLLAKIGTNRKAIVLAAAVIFLAWEDTHGGSDQGKGTWRRFNAADTQILQQMETWGYPLSEVEQLVAHPKSPAKKRARKTATTTTPATPTPEPTDGSPSHQPADEDASPVQAADAVDLDDTAAQQGGPVRGDTPEEPDDEQADDEPADDDPAD